MSKKIEMKEDPMEVDRELDAHSELDEHSWMDIMLSWQSLILSWLIGWLSIIEIS